MCCIYTKALIQFLIFTLLERLCYAGKSYFEKLKDNRCELESNTRAAHNQVAAGKYGLGIMLDYITENMKEQGKPVDCLYLQTDAIPIVSPVGLVDGCTNEENGKLLYDYILSKEGQEILTKNHLGTVRVDIDDSLNSSNSETVSPIDLDLYRMSRRSDGIVETFDSIFNP